MVTLSEERLHAHTVQRPAARIRVRKYVVTEEVMVRVPLRREELRVERLPVNDVPGDAAPSDGGGEALEHELTLMAEEPVVATRAVPRERVRIVKHLITEQEQITDVVRREQLDIRQEPT